MTPLLLIANLARLAGLVLAAPGLWFLAGGLRVVVSGRIDERNRSAKSIQRGILLTVAAICLLFGGTWLANWAIQI